MYNVLHYELCDSFNEGENPQLYGKKLFQYEHKPTKVASVYSMCMSGLDKSGLIL